MTAQGDSERKLFIDEDWKARVQAEKEQLRQQEAKQEQTATAAEDIAKQFAYQLPPASFVALVELVATQAVSVMAEAMRPAKDGEPPRKLPEPTRPLVRHLIDLLGVLEEKTRGNLTADESRYLAHRLHELRMTYIEIT